MRVKVQGVQEAKVLADELFKKARELRSNITAFEQALMDLGITIEGPEGKPPAEEQATD